MNGAPTQSDLPLLTRRQARALILLSAIGILLIQTVLLLVIRNGLVPGFMGDRYTEANVVRSADYFVQNGFTRTVGLPNIMWSDRFAYEGTKAMPETLGTDNGVYLHYPPVPDLIAGLMGKLVGMNQIWLWRLPSIVLNLIAMVILARVLIHVMGIDRAAIMMAALVVTPMIWTFMNGLHFQGYASALWLMQFAILLSAYWLDPGLSRTQMIMLGLLGFGQGWLSFDFFFVVVLLALPIWLMRKAEGAAPDRRSLWLAMIAPCIGFCVAHLMHLIQVMIYFGGVRKGITDYARIAALRSHDIDGTPYIMWLVRAAGLYAFRAAAPNVHFLIWFPMVTALALLAILSRQTQFKFGPNARNVWTCQVSPRYATVLATALAVGLLWLLIMPQHAWFHFHFVGRHLFIFYFCCLFMLLRCIKRQPAEIELDKSRADSQLAAAAM